MWGCLIFSCYIWTPHIILLCMKPLHLMHHIAHCISLYWFVPLLSLYVLFGSSRVDADAEQYEHPQEDRVGASTSDLTGEPTPSPILLLHALLIYCYPYVAILLCHVSYPPVTYISEIHLLALHIVCCLPALRVVGEFRVFCWYLEMFGISCWDVDTCTTFSKWWW